MLQRMAEDMEFSECCKSSLPYWLVSKRYQWTRLPMNRIPSNELHTLLHLQCPTTQVQLGVLPSPSIRCSLSQSQSLFIQAISRKLRVRHLNTLGWTDSTSMSRSRSVTTLRYRPVGQTHQDGTTMGRCVCLFPILNVLPLTWIFQGRCQEQVCWKIFRDQAYW